MHYSCTKFCEKISKCSRVFNGHICKLKNSKGHNSLKNLGRVMVLILCNSSDNDLYLYQLPAFRLKALYMCTKLSENISKGFKVIERI